MRQLLIITILAFVCLLASAQNSRALVVAIDRYPDNSGWLDIHATNDLKIVLPMLKEQGYKASDITVLVNEKATKRAIVEALTSLQRSTRVGDYVYIHFSCHGQQMVDDNGDEEDGLDEAIIPYDARRRFAKGVYEGKNHLRDDELNIYLTNIRTKAGMQGNVIVVFDACHSGDADRDYSDDVYARGTTYIFTPDNYSPPTFDPSISNDINKNPYLSPIVVLSACKSNQVNYEYKADDGLYYGSLRYSLGSQVSLDTKKFTVLKFK